MSQNDAWNGFATKNIEHFSFARVFEHYCLDRKYRCSKGNGPSGLFAGRRSRPRVSPDRGPACQGSNYFDKFLES